MLEFWCGEEEESACATADLITSGASVMLVLFCYIK